MFYDQFISLCNRDDVKPTPLIRKLGFSAGNIKRWENGATVNSDILLAVSEHFKVSIDYLLTGKEKNSSTNILNADEQEMLELFNALSHDNKIRIKERAAVLAELEAPTEPVVEEESEEQETIFIEFSTLRVSAGEGEPLIDDSYPDFIEVKKSELTENANFAVKINGKSMMPHFKDGDVVLVKSQPYVNVGEIGIFVMDGNGYIKERGNDRLISINPEYDDIYFEEGQEIRCKGLVIGTLEEDDFV